MEMLTVEDIKRIFKVEDSTAYKIIRETNIEMKKQGYLTVRGRINPSFIYKKYGLEVDKCQH